MKTNNKMLTTLKLSVQRALVGEITDNLVAVTCGIHEKQVQIVAYFSNEPTERDRERISYIGTEVIADFEEGFTVTEKCLSIANQQLLQLDFWAFARAEILKEQPYRATSPIS